jgi:hypothetical protein
LAEQPPFAVAHSLTSVHASPSPVKPARHAQVRLPTVLVQVAKLEQPPLPAAHSLTSTQLMPDAWKPDAQLTPHVEVAAVQVAVPFAGPGQAVQVVPHEVTAESDTHCCPHAC